MRSEREMFDLILGFAEQNQRIRAVWMNGSRANPGAPRDRYQDYDIVYAVEEVSWFRTNKEWLAIFGETAVMQEPDDATLFGENENDPDTRYAYLMQFADGTRIDLTVLKKDLAHSAVRADKMTRILLDKDHLLGELPVSTDEDYWVRPPTQRQFSGCCNEFWWVSTYVAKGLWRGELLFAIDHLNEFVRPMLLLLLDWQAAHPYNYKISTGKNHKYLDQYIPPDVWAALLETYPTAERNAMWEALFAVCRLFDRQAEAFACQSGFVYNKEEAEKTQRYLRQVQADQ